MLMKLYTKHRRKSTGPKSGLLYAMRKLMLK